MEEDKDNVLFYWYNSKFKLVLESIIVGIFTGLVVVSFRIGIEQLTVCVSNIYKVLQTKLWLLPLWIILLILIGYLLGKIVKHDPMTGGSGIPQVEGVLLRKLDMKWYRVILGKFFGGILGIGLGLSLGREGPSVQLGAAVGQGVSKILKKIKIEEKYLITSGASAGLAAAFNAPLAGTMFALEEVHKNFSPLILISAFSAALSSDFIASGLLGFKPVFDFKHISPIPLNYYIYIIIFGLIMGVTGVIFNTVLLRSSNLYSKQKWIPKEFNAAFPLLISIMFGFFLPQVLGGGNNLIMLLTNVHFSIAFILILLIIKFLFTMVCYGSGAPGGIFLPLLTIGALIGCVYGSLVVNVLGIDASYVNNFIILGMAGYFTAVVKSPITGIILITEMTGSFNNFLSLSIVAIIAYLTSDVLGSRPVYESLLEKFLINNSNNKKVKIEDTKEKFILQVSICMGSYLDGKKVSSIKWPEYCLITEIKRGSQRIIPNGDTVICGGDYITVLTNEDRAGKINDILSNMSQDNRKFNENES
ncbi:ClC family H(+)/Cl(-) exchange transporter [Clostridium sp. JN-1]|jgi:H+/Cl- antiporter ClcA|uniref:ClC family H(+)/Cl(-) exchange transporter n=1 Tax=Clostridium sp. JN-1 TaxID=2483110 RepID=UPI000F0B709B|nr:ClC family H(+)/Cl(-) exchange transporter [Clostridium sp. JN-1]